MPKPKWFLRKALLTERDFVTILILTKETNNKKDKNKHKFSNILRKDEEV